MSEDKDQRTEDPTPKRRKQARDKGQVAKSQDVLAVATFIGGLAALLFGGVSASTLLAHHTQDVLGHLDSGDIATFSASSADVLLVVALPTVAGAALTALVVGFWQVGVQFTPKALIPDFKKLDPIKGFKKVLISVNTIVEVLKASIKLIVVGSIVGSVIYGHVLASSGWAGINAGQVLQSLGGIAFDISWRAALAMVLLAALDFIWQKRQFEKNLKMSKQEVKEEHKESEGDPHVKGARRRRMREAAQRRAEVALEDAAVVVVNPTHVAVALRYSPPKDSAPMVVAKGIDDVAMKVRHEARKLKIPIHHDPPLARRLARKVPLGHPVPNELFKAVAAVLAVVLRARHQRAS